MLQHVNAVVSAVVRPRYLMVAGQPQHIRHERDLVASLTSILVDAVTGTSGAACESDLLAVGFSREELAAHLPHARERAARQLSTKAI